MKQITTPSLPRILNGAALTLIALSVFSQCVGIGLIRSGGQPTDHPGLVFAFSMTSFAIFPGVLLAFAMFLLNAIRSVKDADARIKAVIFLIITLVPFSGTSHLPANGTISNAALSEAVSNAEPESEQFLAGRDWARENKPVRGSQCPGSNEFIRGCRSNIAGRQEEQILAGRAWATENLPAKASGCRGTPYFILGCRRYFHERLAKEKPAGQGRYVGMTTAECKEEVNANFEASEQLDSENGNPQSAAVTRRKSWGPELEDCENYDKLVENKLMPKAYGRLQQAIDTMKAGQAVSEEAKVGMRKDFADMAAVRDQPYKTGYFNLFSEYSRRLDGEYKDAVTVYPKISCDEYQARIDEMRRLDNERVAAMNTLKRSDGTVTDGAAHHNLNQQRIAMLWDWKLYTDGAKAAACDIKSN